MSIEATRPAKGPPSESAGEGVALRAVDAWRASSTDDVGAYLAEADPLDICQTLAGMAAAHDADFDRSVDLVGSHGLMSPRARAMLSTGLIDKMRQTGRPHSRAHAGAFWIDHIETIAEELAKRLFGVAFAELRPLSGAFANGLVFASLASRGDTILAQSRLHGADPSTIPGTFGALFGHAYQDLPFDEANLSVDVEPAQEAIRTIRPRLVVIGSAFMLFPLPVRALKAACQEVGATLFYDGAHVGGLTAGGQFQDPIAEGADVVTGSLPKTICGPTGGIVLSNDTEIGAAIRTMTSRLTSTYPNSHLAALAVTLAELTHFGEDYARAVVANAQGLAHALDAEGFKVLGKRRGFTQSHLVVFDVDAPATEAAKRLDAAGIFTTAIRLPGESPLRGVRVGTVSVTRRGMGVGDMTTIAGFIRRVLIEGEAPAAVARDVAALASALTKVHYCFD